MITLSRVSPALVWRAFFFWAGLVSAAPLFSAVPAGSLPDLAQVGKPTPEKAALLIEQARTSGIPDDYYLDFELRAMPRRAEERAYKGQWWGSRTSQGAITRIELVDGSGTAHRLLIQNGERAKVWRLTNGGAVEVGVAELMAPLISGVDVSAFDLQMPYFYWPGATVERVTRVLGRPANEFVFPAPAEFKAQYAEVTGVRAYLDAQYNVPTKTEVLGAEGKVLKTLSLLNLQTVNEQPIVKSADYRNEVTRDKTRLQVTGVALKLDLPPTLFDPASLGQPASPPPAGSVVRIEP